MKVSGVSIRRNGVKFGYPVVESIYLGVLRKGFRGEDD